MHCPYCRSHMRPSFRLRSALSFHPPQCHACGQRIITPLHETLFVVLVIVICLLILSILVGR